MSNMNPRSENFINLQDITAYKYNLILHLNQEFTIQNELIIVNIFSIFYNYVYIHFIYIIILIRLNFVEFILLLSIPVHYRSRKVHRRV